MSQLTGYILTFFALTLSVAPATAAVNPPSQAATTPREQAVTSEPGMETTDLSLPEAFSSTGEDFTYQVTGRPDPFMPFLETLSRQRESEEELSGLRRFEAGQLTLTAIIIGERESLAMVEDATGRGHVIRPGTLIGRKGEVESISSGKIVIHEASVGPTGETEVRSIEILLNKEGDKKE